MTADDDQTRSTSETTTGTTDRKRRTLLIGALGLLVCAIVAIALGVVLAQGNNNTEGTSSSNSGVSVASPLSSASPTTASPSTVRGSNTVAPTRDGTAPATPAPTSTPTTAPAPSDIETLILSVALQGGNEFSDATSYQSKALAWLKTGTTVYSDAQVVQRYALACLYYSTNAVQTKYTDVQFGSNVVLPWQVNTNWLSDSTVCGWYRITCDSSGLVGKIELYQNVLTGSLPEELTLLKESLYYLDLYLNLIHNEGDTGNGWLGKLTNLKNLYYGSNYFQYDGIPPQISNLPLLESYDCSYNLYFGNLTEKIFANLPKLFYLSMGGNQYSSSIPASIYSLPSLERLYIESSDLTGNLEFLQNMPTILEFWMDDNPNITGTIPTTIGLVTTLASLSLTKLSLKGPLPSELGKLSGMVQMWLYDNALTGTIPSEIGNLAAMSIFEVNSTSIQGTMPSEICALTSNLLISLAADCKSEVNCTCCTECY